MQTIAPCPGDNFIGTPVIACASAALNSEQGSICALGDCGCVLLLPEDADVGVGATVLELPLLAVELLQEIENKNIATAAKQKTFFINASITNPRL
jgi:hypothetical protein